MGKYYSYMMKNLLYLSFHKNSSVSLQYHLHRSEFWVVVEGVIEVTKGKDKSILKRNESTYIEKNEIHKITNIGTRPAKIIEVQLGNYLSEDDIIRIEDQYGRI